MFFLISIFFFINHFLLFLVYLKDRVFRKVYDKNFEIVRILTPPLNSRVNERTRIWIGSFNTVKYDLFPNRFEVNQSISIANICMIFIGLLLLPISNIPAAFPVSSSLLASQFIPLHFSLSLPFSSSLSLLSFYAHRILMCL